MNAASGVAESASQFLDSKPSAYLSAATSDRPWFGAIGLNDSQFLVYVFDVVIQGD